MQDSIVILSIVCPFCGCEHEVEVVESDYLDWQDGKLAQNAFPYLSATEREQIISHICPDCQADFFGDEDDPSDEDYEDYSPTDLDMGFDPYEGCYTFDC